jgi:hypothetical protein
MRLRLECVKGVVINKEMQGDKRSKSDTGEFRVNNGNREGELKQETLSVRVSEREMKRERH